MKPTKTKRELRDELQRQINSYLHHGGAVNAVPQGLSGREDTRAPLTSIFTGQGSEERTLLPDVVAAIESRRHPPAPHKSRYKPRPKKKVILDDFGQPLRWEWVEE